MTMADAVVKLGGSALRDGAAYGRATRALSALRGRGVLVVPGGGPLADAVRALDASVGLDDDSAHWMAVLAMEQHAELLAARIEGACVVHDPGELAGALATDALPVLAPYRWLRDADPLPHSWMVTSDSIAAWVATVLGANRLVLVKPIAAPVASVVDPWFHRALGPGVAATTVALWDVASLPERLPAASRAGARR